MCIFLQFDEMAAKSKKKKICHFHGRNITATNPLSANSAKRKLFLWIHIMPLFRLHALLFRWTSNFRTSKITQFFFLPENCLQVVGVHWLFQNLTIFIIKNANFGEIEILSEINSELLFYHNHFFLCVECIQTYVWQTYVYKIIAFINWSTREKNWKKIDKEKKSFKYFSILLLHFKIITF